MLLIWLQEKMNQKKINKILLKTYLMKYLFQINRRITLTCIQYDYRKKINQKYLNKIYFANVNINLMEENIIQIKRGITINVNESVKTIIYVRKIIFRILLHVVVKMVNISQALLTRNKSSSNKF